MKDDNKSNNLKLCINCGKVPNKFYRQVYCGTCCNKLLANGKIPRLIEKMPPLPIEFTEIQKEILTGLLLGDGHLTRPGSETANSNLFVLRSAKDTDYLMDNYETFRSFCSNKAIRTRKLAMGPLDIINGKPKSDRQTKGIEFRTRNSILFTEYRKTWYDYNGVKIIPKSFVKLTPLMIAIWLCDDGNIDIYHNKRISITLYTNGFSIDDVKYLISLLEKRYPNETFLLNMYAKKNRIKTYPIIRMNDAAARTLLKDIDGVFPKSMSRKSEIYRHPGIHFYSDEPKRYESKKRVKALRIIDSKNALKVMYHNGILEFNIKLFGSYANLPGTNTKKSYLERMVKEGLVYLKLDLGRYNEKTYTFTENGLKLVQLKESA